MLKEGASISKEDERGNRRILFAGIGIVLLTVGFTMMVIFGSVLYSEMYSTGWTPFLMLVSIILMGIGLIYFFYTAFFWKKS